MPFASSWTSRTGQLTGLPEHALQLLEAERLLMVFPEGARGTAKLFHERNTLVGFGTGFMRLALRSRCPIVPFAFVGGGEAVPTILNLRRLARVIGTPYVPLTPYLAPLPLPVRLDIHFGAPVLFEGTGDEEDDAVTRQVEDVKRAIAALQRRTIDLRRRPA
jgi:1-acyl-sn-glycerol-3-phosphate acyltransferase